MYAYNMYIYTAAGRLEENDCTLLAVRLFIMKEGGFFIWESEEELWEGSNWHGGVKFPLFSASCLKYGWCCLGLLVSFGFCWGVQHITLTFFRTHWRSKQNFTMMVSLVSWRSFLKSFYFFEVLRDRWS